MGYFIKYPIPITLFALGLCMHLTIDDVQPLPLDSKDKVKEIFAMLDDIGIAHKQNLCQFIQHSDGDVTCTPPIS